MRATVLLRWWCRLEGQSHREKCLATGPLVVGARCQSGLDVSMPPLFSASVETGRTVEDAQRFGDVRRGGREEDPAGMWDVHIYWLWSGGWWVSSS